VAKKKHSKRPKAPSPGRNLAVRSGGGSHTLDAEKREADRLRHEIEEQRQDRDIPESGR